MKKFDIIDRVSITSNVNQQVDAANKRAGEAIKVAQSFTRLKGQPVRDQPDGIVKHVLTLRGGNGRMNLGLEDPDGRMKIRLPIHRDSKQLENEASVNRLLAKDYNVSSDHYRRASCNA